MFSAVWSISMMIVVIVARTIVTVARTILTMMDRRIWVTVGHVVCLGGMQARRDWNTIVCFSCGKLGHGVSRCPELNETFPFMLPGWTAEKVGSSYMMISTRVAAERH